MSELNPRPQEAEALDIIESMLDVADMKCTGPLYADDPPRNGLCRIPEEDAAILRQYIADRRTHPANDRFADCHIWEPGDKLDSISDKCDVLIKAADIKALIAQPSYDPLCAENENFIQNKFGYCFYSLGDQPFIYNLYVHPQYRRNGHSKILLGLVIREIRKSGYRGWVGIQAEPRENSIGLEDLTRYYKSFGLTVCPPERSENDA
ncbi:hypothetical protein OBV_25300 [Oscillibacter valericigenes Sjm18-20]|nr:hypothetical protein OBV_25300 [Oscillibacter valericigenes Sjm18-20]